MTTIERMMVLNSIPVEVKAIIICVPLEEKSGLRTLLGGRSNGGY